MDKKGSETMLGMQISAADGGGQMPTSKTQIEAIMNTGQYKPDTSLQSPTTRHYGEIQAP